MPWVLDGNNLAGGRDRAAVRAAALELARAQRMTIVLFFDGAPPPGSREVEPLGRVQVRYAADADAAIVAMLATAGPGWRLVSDDAELGRRARAAGAAVFPARAFWEKVEAAPRSAQGAGAVDLAGEMAYFAAGRPRTDEDRPQRVRRRRRRD